MKKILLVSDSPYATTGLGRMSKYFLKMLPEFDWHIWGFFHPNFKVKHGVWTADFNASDFKAKFNIMSPQTLTQDHYGLQYLPQYIEAVKPDILLTSMDYSRIAGIAKEIKQMQFVVPFKWVNYFPMDREDFKTIELDAYRFPDINVCITKFGVKKFKEINPKIHLEQIWHPVDKKDFPDMTIEQRKEFNKSVWPAFDENSYRIGTVNRSFSRKDTARLILAFTKFMLKNKDTNAYFHGSQKTVEGIDLAQLAAENGLEGNRMACLPKNILEPDALPDKFLNGVYKTMDMFVTVSTGEGFGFSTVEALLNEVPFIGPKHTSFPELVQDFGYLIEPDGMAFLGNGTTTMWPILNVDEVVDKMQHVKDHQEEAKAKAKAGSQWVKKNLNLATIAKQWRKILTQK